MPMEIAGVTDAETVMVMRLLVTVPGPQSALPVITQEMTSPLLNKLVVKVLELVPVVDPFFFH